MKPIYTSAALFLLLTLLFGQGCSEEPPDRFSPVIDLLELAPPDLVPTGWEPPAVERLSWNFSNGLPDGWTAGPEGVRVTTTRKGLRLESDGADPWLELRLDIDPLFYDRLVINLTPLTREHPALQFAFHQPGRYRTYGVRTQKPGTPGEPRNCMFKVPRPDATESAVRSIRFQPGGSGAALIRRATLMPRGKNFIRKKILNKDLLPLAQEFKRCWRFAGGGERKITFTVPGSGARLGFATGTLTGAAPGRFSVELDAGGGPEAILSAPVARAGEGWLSEWADLSRYAGREVTLRIRVETEDPKAIHLIGAPMVFAADEEPRPNVLLIMVDTLRADHLSGYGHHRNTSPHLDRLARQGMLFTAAAAPASWTIPSVAATLTGRYPGSEDIGHGRAAGIPAGTPTLAGLLGGAGYSTAGFAANALLDDVRGFHHGFGHYFFAPYTDNQFTAAELNRRALAWFEHHDDERFFCFLHYMDPHNPYDPPPFRPEPQDPDSPTAWQEGNVRALIAGQVEVKTADDLERINRFYDEEVRYVDRQIGLLLARLKHRGLLENTVVLISADHGEELHDRGNWGHGFTLYEELIHVPLIVRLPDTMNCEAGLVESPVSLVDVLPTIAGLTGVPLPRNDLPGRSLLEPAGERFLRSGIWGKRAPDLYAVSRGPQKYIFLKDLPGGRGGLRNSKRFETVRETAGAEMFFDLQADPGEEHNLAGEAPETETGLREEMARWMTEMSVASSPDQGEQGKIDRELEEKLRAMGYMK